MTVVLAAAANGVQGELTAFARQPGLDPAHWLGIGEIVPGRGKVD